jgi:hypothetical protein
MLAAAANLVRNNLTCPALSFSNISTAEPRVDRQKYLSIWQKIASDNLREVRFPRACWATVLFGQVSGKIRFGTTRRKLSLNSFNPLVKLWSGAFH